MQLQRLHTQRGAIHKETPGMTAQGSAASQHFFKYPRQQPLQHALVSGCRRSPATGTRTALAAAEAAPRHRRSQLQGARAHRPHLEVCQRQPPAAQRRPSHRTAPCPEAPAGLGLLHAPRCFSCSSIPAAQPENISVFPWGELQVLLPLPHLGGCSLVGWKPAPTPASCLGPPAGRRGWVTPFGAG